VTCDLPPVIHLDGHLSWIKDKTAFSFGGRVQIESTSCMFATTSDRWQNYSPLLVAKGGIFSHLGGNSSSGRVCVRKSDRLSEPFISTRTGTPPRRC